MVRLSFAEKPLKVLSVTVSISAKLLRLNFFSQWNITSTNTFLVFTVYKTLFWEICGM